MFLTKDGRVLTVGKNSSGQLGDGTNEDKNSPVYVTGQNGTILKGVTAVAAGYEHTLFLMNDGSVFSVGQNSQGQLGNGTQTSSFQSRSSYARRWLEFK